MSPRSEPAGARPGPRDHQSSGCCPLYHEAVELIGKRWTGAIVRVLMERPMRFSEISSSVPELSDRLLSERMKELEARGVVRRTVISGPPVRVQYALSDMGRDLGPALDELQVWARRWLAADARARARAGTPAGPPARGRAASGAR